jgi:ATP-dependent Clp protease ATP-binding subunit ClpC
MFEKFTEAARHLIFFARHEASQVGNTWIEPEHLLLALLREDRALVGRFVSSRSQLDSLRRDVEERLTVATAASTHVDLPLSQSGKRVLAYAAEESERLGHKHIGTEHVLVGLLREEKSVAADLLRVRSFSVAKVREGLGRAATHTDVVLTQFGRDLAESIGALQSGLPVNRDIEVELAIRTLCRCSCNNPVLLGESEISTRSIVEGLARRVADGSVPQPLQNKRLVAVDIVRIEMESPGIIQFKERVNSLVRELHEAEDLLLFIGEFSSLGTSVTVDGWADVVSLMTPSLLAGYIRCISTTTSSEFSTIMERHPALVSCFQPVPVRPLDDEESISVFASLKERLELFHRVRYDDEAVAVALEYARRQASKHPFYIVATDLLDSAGAKVRISRDTLPPEIREVQKRIAFIVRRMEGCIANHEFEKARFYSDEERKEREALRQLRAQNESVEVADVANLTVVTQKDVEAVASEAPEMA